MKRVIFGFITITALAVLGFAPFANAQQGNHNKQSTDIGYSLPAGKKHSGNIYTSSRNIQINGNIEGSLYCAASSVLVINGRVSGDVVCLASKVIINGEIGQDLRIAGSDISLKGKVNGDASIASLDKVNLAPESTISKDLQIYGSSTEISGEIGNNAYISSHNLKAGNMVKIGGDLSYSSVDEINFANGQVKGKINYNQVQNNDNAALSVIMIMLMLLVLSMIIVLVVPGRVHRSSEIAKGNFITVILAGVATVFLVPIVAILLTLSVIGIPVAIVMGFAYVIILIMSAPFFVYLLGSILLSGVKNIPLRMLGGVVFFVALCMIPFVNVVAILSSLFIGTGIVIRLVTDGYKMPRYTLNPPAPKPPMPDALLDTSDNQDTDITKNSSEATPKDAKPSAKKKTPSKSSVKSSKKESE